MNPERPFSADKLAQVEDLLRQDVYTPDQAASLLGMDVQQLYAAAFRGDLKAHIVGQDVVSVTRADVLAWFRDRS